MLRSAERLKVKGWREEDGSSHVEYPVIRIDSSYIKTRWTHLFVVLSRALHS